MRIAQVIFRYLPMVGGAEVYADCLRRAFAPIASEQTIFQSETGATGDGVVSVPVPHRTGFKLVDFNLALRAYRAELGRFDVVVVHNPEHLARWMNRRRSILLSHGATWTHEHRAWRRSLRRRSMQTGFRRAGAVVANDSFVPRELGVPALPGERFHQEIAPRIWFVPNAVDPEIFRPPVAGEAEPRIAGLPGSDQGPLVLVPRNLTRARGIDLAIAAFAAAHALPATAQLVIVGDAIRDMPTSVRYRAELDALVGAHRLQGRVHFLGGVRREQMPALYRAATLTLVPTRYSEGTSLAALESMATGVATLTTAVEGLLDLPGPHVPPEIPALAAGLDDLWARREEIAATQRHAVLRDFCRQRWEESWRAIARRIGAAEAERNAGGRPS